MCSSSFLESWRLLSEQQKLKIVFSDSQMMSIGIALIAIVTVAIVVNALIVTGLLLSGVIKYFRKKCQQRVTITPILPAESADKSLFVSHLQNECDTSETPSNCNVSMSSSKKGDSSLFVSRCSASPRLRKVALEKDIILKKKIAALKKFTFTHEDLLNEEQSKSPSRIHITSAKGEQFAKHSDAKSIIRKDSHTESRRNSHVDTTMDETSDCPTPDMHPRSIFAGRRINIK